MKKILNFANNGTISLLDLTTMGDSSKREDSTKTGQFDSGLKYAISILVRNKVDFEILTGDYKYTFSEYMKTEGDKSKNLIRIKQHNWKTAEDAFFVSAFAVNLGFDWDFWMAIRELYSNCMDEKGDVKYEISDNSYYETQIILDASHDKVAKIVDNWESYFLDAGSPIFQSGNVKVWNNNLPDKSYRIYKNGVLVYSDSYKQSMYLYDVSNCSIDERRQLLSTTSTEIEISYAVRKFDSETLVSSFIENYNEDYVESELINWGYYSKAWVAVINRCHEEKSLPAISSKLLGDMYSDERFQLNKRKISSGDWINSKVTVEPSVDIQMDFMEAIANMCKNHNIELKYPIKESLISNSFKALADTRESCLYIDKSFTEEDLWEIVKEQFRMDSTDKNLIYKEYVKLLNK